MPRKTESTVRPYEHLLAAARLHAASEKGEAQSPDGAGPAEALDTPASAGPGRSRRPSRPKARTK